MTDAGPPLLIEPQVLEGLLGSPDLRVLDLSKPDTHTRFHVPGAVLFNYGDLIRGQKPVMGALPEISALEASLRSAGISNNTHVVAYDDEGGGKAARLLWTLQLLGHERLSLLNGGLHAWANEGFRLDSSATPVPDAGDFTAQLDDARMADMEWIRAHADDANVQLLDARSPSEYSGQKTFSQRGGHIPGAINLEWTDCMDKMKNLRLRPREELLAELQRRGFSPDKEIVTYCQTHHRSAYMCLVLNWLGYEKVRGYPGSWAEWGNHPEVPVDT